MNGIALITLWCQQFVGREPSQQDLANGQALTTPEQAIDLLVGVASCDECFAHFHDDAYGQWVYGVFTRIANRTPSPIEAAWAGIIMSSNPGMEGRSAVVRQLVIQYPPTLE